MLLVFFFFLRSCLLTVFDFFVSMCCLCFFFFFKELLTYSLLKEFLRSFHGFLCVFCFPVLNCFFGLALMGFLWVVRFFKGF